MIRPLADISTDMHSFSEGSLSIDVDIHSDDEIGQLADSIRSSTHTLREIILDRSLIHIYKRISIELLLLPDVQLVYADRRKIQQVLYNLMDNAIKFSENESTVTVEFTGRSEKVFILSLIHI